MAPPKRKSTVPSAAPFKKMKIDEWADVSKVIMTTDLPVGVHDMLERILPLTLGEFADHRHKFQEKMVSALEDILKEVEQSQSKHVAEIQAQLEDANKNKPESEKSKDEAFQRRDTKALEVREKKDALAAAALGFRAARKEMGAASEAKRVDETEFVEAERKTAEFASMMEDLAFLRSATADDPEAVSKRSSLVAMMRRCNFEEAMMVVIPAVFSKPPSARGEFDDIAVDGLAASLRKRMSQQEAIVAAQAPVQEERKAAIVAAEAALESAEVQQVEAAESYTAVAAHLKACEEEAAVAQKAARDACTKIKKLSGTLTNAEAELEIFRDGPLSTFRRLQQRMAPVVEEPVTTTCEKQDSPMPEVEAPEAVSPTPATEVVEATTA